MRTDELQLLRKMVRDGESRKLSAADFALLLRIRHALQEYDATAIEQQIPDSKPSKE
jgi:hypothetical protein